MLKKLISVLFVVAVLLTSAVPQAHAANWKFIGENDIVSASVNMDTIVHYTTENGDRITKGAFSSIVKSERVEIVHYVYVNDATLKYMYTDKCQYDQNGDRLGCYKADEPPSYPKRNSLLEDVLRFMINHNRVY